MSNDSTMELGMYVQIVTTLMAKTALSVLRHDESGSYTRIYRLATYVNGF